MLKQFIRGGFDHSNAIIDGEYNIYPHKENIKILEENQGREITLRLIDKKDKHSRFFVTIKNYTYEFLSDEETRKLTKKYKYEPVCKNFSENWNLRIKFDYKDVVFPEKMKKQSNKITNYFQKK
jgi:hypothetical protein